MKIHYTFVLILMLLLSSCASNKGIQKEAPFVLGNVYTQRWVAEDNLLQEGYSVLYLLFL